MARVLPRPQILMIYMAIYYYWVQSRVAKFFPPQKFLVTKVPEIAFSFPNVPFSRVFRYVSGDLGLWTESLFKKIFIVHEPRQGVMTRGQALA